MKLRTAAAALALLLFLFSGGPGEALAGITSWWGLGLAIVTGLVAGNVVGKPVGQRCTVFEHLYGEPFAVVDRVKPGTTLGRHQWLAGSTHLQRPREALKVLAAGFAVDHVISPSTDVGGEGQGQFTHVLANNGRRVEARAKHAPCWHQQLVDLQHVTAG